MKIIIDLVEYTPITSLDFAPEVDLVGDSLPINQFTVDIVTQDSISAGQYAELRDDLDNLWARYWIVGADRTDENIVHLSARSEVELLDGVTLAPVMYTAEPIQNVLDDTMVRQAGGGLVAIIDYDVEQDLLTETVTGFCPQQTARERLQWVLFTAGAYLKTAFVPKPTIMRVDETETLVPISKTFWRPTINYSDWVTAVRVTAYTFTQDADAAASNTSYEFPLPWVATPQTLELVNPDIPGDVADNVVEIDSLYLINPGNASAILSRMAQRYFKRTSIDLDIINNADYAPGDKLIVFTDEATLYSGYCERTAFQFGLQARSTLQLTSTDSVESGILIINYMCEGVCIEQATFTLPVSYEYSLENIYIDKTHNGHRYIYRPLNKYVTGTIQEGTNEVYVEYEIGLDLFNGILSIYAVDGINIIMEMDENVGVIE